MTIASCPRCRDEVTIPVGAAETAKVRCPLCQEEYELAEALHRLPPALILVNAPEGAEQHAPSFGDFAAIAASAAAAGEESEVKLQPADDSQSSPAAVTPSFTATPRAQKKQKSAAWEVGKIAGGGVLGLAIGQLLLWWLPLPAGKGDPFKLGPKVAQYVPWLVPATYSGAVGGDGGESFNTEGNRFLDALDQAKHDSAQPRSSRRRPGANRQAAGQPAAGAPAAEEPVDLLTDNQYEVLTQSPESEQKFNQPLVPDVPSIDLDLAALGQSSSQPPSEPAAREMRIGGVRDAPTISAVQVLESIQESAAAAQTFAKATDSAPAEPSEEEQSALLRRSAILYQSLAFVAEGVTFLDPADEDALAATESLRVFLRDFADRPVTLKMLSGLTPTWLGKTNRACDGVVLIGDVVEISASDRLFETRMKLLPREGESAEQEVTVVSAANPQDSYDVGDRLVLLGAIVDNPTENLAGYRGTSPQVVLGGFPVRLGGSSTQ